MTSARPLIVRLLGGSGAVIVFLIALIASLGAALGAPLGLFLVRRRARRRNRHASRIASFVGAVASATVVGVVIWWRHAACGEALRRDEGLACAARHRVEDVVARVHTRRE